MSFREMVLRRLSFGRSDALDPEEVVEVEVVPLSMGPLVESALQRQRVPVTLIDTFDVVTKTLSKTSVRVPRKSVEQARAVLEGFR